MDRNIKNRLIYKMVFCIIAFFAVARITFLFVSERNGFHSDEIWSYGFANSYYNPYIYEIRGENYVDHLKTQNIEEWITGDTFKDYIVVNEGEEFTFDSVIDNKRGDNSPALYEILLHFVCSFFPGRFSWWFGFSIQLFFLVLTMLLLYCTACRLFLLFEDKYANIYALLCILLYSCSIGFADTFLYIRMYGMLTFFCLSIVRLSLEALNYNVKSKKKLLWYLGILVTTILGGYTHFYYFVFAFFYTFFFCLCMIWKKTRPAIEFGFVQLFSVLVYFVVYSDAFLMLTSYRKTSKPTISGLLYVWDLRLAFTYLIRDITGVALDFHKFVLGPWLYLFAFLLIILGLVMFVFRKEVGSYQLLARLKKIKFAYSCSPLLGIVGTTLCYTLFIARYSDVRTMGDTADRYLVCMMPEIMLALTGVFALLIKHSCKTKKIMVLGSCILYLFFLVSGLTGKCVYLFSNMEAHKLETYCRNKNVVVLMMSDWELIWLTEPLMESNYVYAFTYNPDLKPEKAIDTLAKNIPEELVGEEALLIITSNVFANNNTERTEDGSLRMDITSDLLLLGVPELTEDDWLEMFVRSVKLSKKPIYKDRINTFIGIEDVYEIAF